MLIMSAVAVFTCHPSSHPFQTRRIDLSESVKIGRSVAKSRPAPENAIFDCKVLSRNHALLYYDKDTGKFCLQDTKSSNGTFVNNQRLTQGNGENPETEVRSGDIVQFGVDVVDTSKRVVVTHGRIVAQLTLYNPDGSEAVRSTPLPSVPSNNESPAGGGVTNNNIVSQQLFQLSHWLKEALYREQMLEQKLSTLQSLVSSTQDASESSWQALIDEDRLVSRLEVLENQLRAYSKANSEDSIRVELAQLQEDKHMYETTAKESLKKALEEKLEASQKYADIELKLANYQEEVAHLTQQVDNQNNEQKTLLENLSSSKEEVQELTEKLAELERNHLFELERMKEERSELERRIASMEEKEGEFAMRIKTLQNESIKRASSDAPSSEVISSADSVKTIKPSRTYSILPTINGDHKPGERDEGDGAENIDTKQTINGEKNGINISPESSSQGSGSRDGKEEKANDSDASTPESEAPVLTETTEALERLKAQVAAMEEQLKETSERADQAEQELAEAQMDSIQYMATIEELETQVKELKEATDKTAKDSEPVVQDTSSGRVESIEMANLGISTDLTLIQNQVDKEFIARLEQKHCEQLEHEQKEVECLRISYFKLKEELEKMRECSIVALEQELEELQEAHKSLKKEKDLLAKNLESTKTENEKLVNETKHLKEQSAKHTASTKDAKRELMELRDQLKLEKQAGKTRDSAVTHAEDLLSREKRISLERKKKVEELEKTQSISMKVAKANEKELEKLKEHNAKLQKDLEREKFLKSEAEKKLKAQSGFRKGPDLRKGQRRDSDSKRIAEIEPVIAVREQQILQSRIPVTNSPKSSGNHISINLDSSSDVTSLKGTELNDKLNGSLDRLSDDLAKLRDRLHEAEVKASSDSSRLGARLKTELSKSQEEIERVLANCRTNKEEKDRLLRELSCLRDGTGSIAGIQVNNLPAVVIGIAIFAAVVQVAFALWAGE